jgi:hypothetical protein
MPSLQHEALLLLFRNRPLLAPELLRDVLHQPLPLFTEARVESAELTDIQPAEYRADLVVLLLDEQPVLARISHKAAQRASSKVMTSIDFQAMKPANYEFQSEFARRYHSTAKVEGRAETLIELAAQKFGPWGAEVEALIRSATAAQLEGMTRRLL